MTESAYTSPATRLADISRELKEGRAIQPVTVRTFLSWYGAQRRGSFIVWIIKRELQKAGLETSPDFESAWLDSTINFVLRATEDTSAGNAELSASEQQDSCEIEGTATNSAISWVSRDATYRVSKLQAANQQIVSISPDGTLSQTVTHLLAGDYSQLPVMTSEREVKGVITWKSIGARMALGISDGKARDFMETHREIRSDMSIFDAIPIIVSYDYVLVRGPDQRITGIITSSDLSLQFQKLTEPFLLLSEIENLVRNMIGERFSAAELESARDPGTTGRPIETVADMTFGDYIRLLQEPERWSKLSLAIDRKIFCEKLDNVRTVRNDVMHFDPDGISDSDLESLRDFTGFLKQLEVISCRNQSAS